MTKDRLVVAMTVTLACALLASWSHLSAVFSLMFAPVTVAGMAVPLGPIAATAIDGTMFTLALALGEVAGHRAELGQRSRSRLYWGLGSLLGISALFNLDAAVTHLAGQRPLAGAAVAGVDMLDLARAIVGAATLPLLGAYLTHGLTELATARALLNGRRVPAPRAELPVAGPATASLPPVAAEPPRKRPAGGLTAAQIELGQRYARLAESSGTDDDVAVATGKSQRTIRRWRRYAQELGLV